MDNNFLAVDADGHLEENHIDWKERLPDKYKFQAPVRKPAGMGHLRLYLEGKAWPRPYGLGIGIGGTVGTTGTAGTFGTMDLS